MAAKLGIVSSPSTKSEDEKLIVMWLDILEKEKLDFTLSFRKLSGLLEVNEKHINLRFSPSSEFENFVHVWRKRLKKDNIDIATIKEKMNRVNPMYIPRNHQVERAIQSANDDDLTVFNEMNKVLINPYKHQPDLDSYGAAPLPEEEIKATFCGT